VVAAPHWHVGSVQRTAKRVSRHRFGRRRAAVGFGLVRDQLEELVTAGFRHVVVDLRDLEFIDSCGRHLRVTANWRVGEASFIQGDRFRHAARHQVERPLAQRADSGARLHRKLEAGRCVVGDTASVGCVGA